MKLLSLFLACFTAIFSYPVYSQQIERKCACKDCKCSVNSHCGCYSEKGCTCKENRAQCCSAKPSN